MSELEEYKESQLQLFKDWMEEGAGVDYFDKRYEYLHHLIQCNGGWHVHQWGIIGTREGEYFKRGLDQNEATDLMSLFEAYKVWTSIDRGCHMLFMKYMKIQGDKIKEKYNLDDDYCKRYA